MTASPSADLPAAGTLLGVERPEIHWPGYIISTVVMLLIVALLYALMRRAWRRRGLSDLPALPEPPHDLGPAQMTATGRYHGSTAAGQWLERIVAHGLGARSQAELRLHDAGLDITRPGTSGFFVDAAVLRGARLDKAIAGKVLTEGALLIVTWEHGGRLLDSGFRCDRAADHPAWVDALNAIAETAPGTDRTTATTGAAASGAPHTEEGAP